MRLYHVVLWHNGRVAESINVRAKSKLEALTEARFQYPNYTPEVTMETTPSEPPQLMEEQG